MARHIDKVGFEIEGGWSGERYINPFDDIQLIRDNSINGQTLGDSSPIRATHVGEAVSPPLDFAQGEWKPWLMSHWPNADTPHRTNRTCGYHIHLSTRTNRDYMLLTSKELLYRVRDRMEAVGKDLKLHSRHVFWERMEGMNNFCRLQFNTGRQMEITKNERHGNRMRYGFFNFSLTAHGTMEFRALPTFRDAHIALRFTEAYLDEVEMFLEKMQGQKIGFQASLAS